ncbi:hypothetical protein T03_7050 [Trichinella britovi]|uniref:Uncharacterized protein n=1 Tax=Trichinella britovi TaxID=45882 RepID=A0A0V1ALM8_TRIBR|nr:hypothetical protein T03_7050 [Trichinella britovi]
MVLKSGITVEHVPKTTLPLVEQPNFTSLIAQ